MLNALTNTDLESQFEAIKEELRSLHFSKIEDRLLLRAHYLSTGTDIYKMSPSSYVKLLAKNQSRDYSLETKIGLSRAAKFLRKECNVPGIDWLPYGLQFLLIGEFFRLNPTPSGLQYDKLKTWFWQTSYLGWFGSASGAKVNLAITEIRKLADDANHEIKIADSNSRAVDFPLVQKANSARVSTFYLFYFSLQPRTIQPKATPTGKMTIELMASGPKEVLNPLFSSAKPKNKIANLVLSDIATPVTIIDAFKNDPGLAASHGVTSDALECLMNNDQDGFLQERQAELIRLESEFIKKWGLSPSDQNPKDSSEDSEIE